MEWLNSLEPHWFWLLAGLLLGAAEIIVPGFFLIWFAIAAVVTGMLAFVLPGAIALQIGVFAVVAVAMVYFGRRWFAANPIVSSDPLLNDRSARLVGEIVTVVDAIEHGSGRVKVGDSVWSAKGADAAVGAKVRISGANGSVLMVEGV